jgi:uncharacterized repeat protein (TIGR03803 family)
MKTLAPWMVVLVALLPGFSKAQTYTQVYGFSLYSGSLANNDGAVPYCSLVLSSNVLYGTTSGGGTNGQGTVFCVQTDGNNFKVLHTFSALSSGFYGYNSDGAQPYDGLVLSGDNLYGTAYGGGSSAYGTVFRLNLDGSGFTNLHNFTDGLGAPRAGLLLSSNVLFGTTFTGGAGYGSVFRIYTNGTGFTILHSFTSLPNDAGNPAGGLVLAGNTLYGTAAAGGSLAGGTVFALSTAGTGYTNLANFQLPPAASHSSTNTTGGQPYASPLLVGDTLYGTTLYGGTNGNGVIFAVKTNGTGFTNMHTFATGVEGSIGATNADGASPECQLVLVGSNLYGTTLTGGTNGYGTVFAINTNGSGFRVVYNFVPIFNGAFVNSGGNGPGAGLIFSGGTFYGTTTSGGIADGNVYALNLSIPLAAQLTTGKLVLSWANSAFTLQATPSLGVSFTNVVNATSPYTNSVAGSRLFFRLQAN